MLLTDMLGSKTTPLAPRSGLLGSVMAGGEAVAPPGPARAMTSPTARIRPRPKARGPLRFIEAAPPACGSGDGGVMRSTFSPWGHDASMGRPDAVSAQRRRTSAPIADTCRSMTATSCRSLPWPGQGGPGVALVVSTCGARRAMAGELFAAEALRAGSPGSRALGAVQLC